MQTRKPTNNVALWRVGILAVLTLTALTVSVAQAAGDESAVAMPRGTSVSAIASSHAFLSAPTPPGALRVSGLVAHAMDASRIVPTDALAARATYVVVASK